MTAAPASYRIAAAAAATLLAASGVQAAAPPSLRQAFAAAYPKPIQRVKTGDADSDRMRFSPLLLVAIGPGRYALVSKARNLDHTCHGCSGGYGVAYLKVAGRGLGLEAPPFAEADSEGGFGAPPRLDIVSGLGSPPVLRVSGNHEGMGALESWQSLVRLGPDARAVKVGATLPVGLRVTDPENHVTCAIAATLQANAKDQSFTLRYTGRLKREVHYSWAAGRWTAPNAVADVEALYDACPK